MNNHKVTDTTEILNKKKLIRHQMYETIDVMAQDPLSISNSGILASSIFTTSKIFLNARTILVYMATNHEIDSRPIIQAALKAGKNVAIPRTNNNDLSMSFHYLSAEKSLADQTECRSFSIMEPLESLPTVNTERLPVNTIIIVPGVAFSRTGNRLGHGYGYYDRFIDKIYTNKSIIHLPNALVGLCFSFQLIQDVPVEEHDIPLTHILTENEFFAC